MGVERRERYRPPQREPAYRRPGSRRQSFVRDSRPHQYERQRPSPYSRGEVVSHDFPPRRQYSSSVQQWERPLPGLQVSPPRVQRPTVGISGFDYEDYGDVDYSVQAQQQPVTKKPNLFSSIFNLIKPKRPTKPPVETEPSLSRPSWEFVQGENEVEVDEKVAAVDTDQFVPTNADYEDYSLNYVDTDDEPKYPQYTMKDVLYRPLTIFSFLKASAARAPPTIAFFANSTFPATRAAVGMVARVAPEAPVNTKPPATVKADAATASGKKSG